MFDSAAESLSQLLSSAVVAGKLLRMTWTQGRGRVPVKLY